jgi:phosphatidylglycerol:prolipoprotein diacylglycerol transferase
VIPEIGPIQSFGVMFALAFLACGAMAARRYKELGKPADYAYEVVFAALIGGLVGARAYYLIQHPDEFGLSGIFSGSGLVFWGGALGGAIGVLLWAWWRGMLNGRQIDMGGIGLAIGYSIGRIGCQLSGDGDYGTASSLPWAMAYPDGTVPTTEEVHPTPIYETLSMGLVAWLLWRWRDALKPGAIFGLYLVFAGVERFLVEFIRRNDDVALGLTAAQLEAVGALIIGAAIIAYVARRNGGELFERDAPSREVAAAR